MKESGERGSTSDRTLGTDRGGSPGALRRAAPRLPPALSATPGTNNPATAPGCRAELRCGTGGGGVRRGHRRAATSAPACLGPGLAAEPPNGPQAAATGGH